MNEKKDRPETLKGWRLHPWVVAISYVYLAVTLIAALYGMNNGYGFPDYMGLLIPGLVSFFLIQLQKLPIWKKVDNE